MLIKYNIEQLEEPANRKKSIKFRCLVCYHEWNNSIRNVLDRNQGCPKCSGMYHDTSTVSKTLNSRDIHLISEYVNNKLPIKVKCAIDGYEWETVAYGLLRKKNPGKCPKCANRIPITNDVLDERLVGTGIKRIGSCEVSARKRIQFLCLSCNKQWETAPATILGGCGCPLCKNKNEKAIVDYLKSRKVDFEYHKKVIINGKRFHVDFVIGNTYVEYNGEQHYKPIRFGGMSLDKAIINFEKQKIRDEMLRNYCQSNGIQLIEISYNSDVFNVLDSIFKNP